ncbi:MAG: SpoIIE family protein phosphatase [Solirubrobacterales bacterium]
MKSNNYKLWTAISLALLVAACVVSITLGDDTRIISTLVVPPLIAGLGTTPRRTALVSALSVAAAVSLGVLHDTSAITTALMLRIGVVTLVAALSVQTAILRERDQRTRRRLLLINASRDQLEAAQGVEEALTSFCRAAVAAEFAEWAVLDLRLPDGERLRIVEQSEKADHLDIAVRERPGAATIAYESDVERGGPILLRDAPRDLVDDLFETGPGESLTRPNSMIMGVSVGELRGFYHLICPDPHPPWGAAEVTQVGSLTRQAAQRARSDQLIDRITHAQGELQESRDEINAIIGGIASGIVAQRPDGEIVYANDVAAEMLDWASADEMIGSNFGEVINRLVLRHEDGRPFDPDAVPSRRALRGEDHPTDLFRYIVKSTGEELWMFVRSTAIFDHKGDPALAIAVIEDNTERKRTELSQAFLADASAKLAVSLDFDSVVHAIANAAIPTIADWCTVELAGPGGAIETVAVAHADPAKVATVRKFRDDFPIRRDDDYGPARAITRGEPSLYEQVDEERLRELYHDTAREQAVAEIRTRSSLTAPIVVRGEPIGSIMLAISRPGARFTKYDLDTIVELGRRAGIALDNARMHTERMRMLASLQKSLIPAELPHLDHLDLTATFRPAERDAEVGGDFYDAFELPDGSSALVIGDVCGKGPEAAALTALARYTIRTCAMNETNPQTILTQLNAALLDQVTDGRFCTVAFVRVSGSPEGELEVEAISAGHPLPLVLGPGEPRAVGRPGTLLGVVDSPDLPVERSTLTRGESLLLYTDGLSAGQTTDDTLYALELVGRTNLNVNGDIAAAVDRAAVDSQLEPNRDDVAILVASVRYR